MGPTDRFFPICWFFIFYFNKKIAKSAVFWTNIWMKNCERSEQEKIKILKLFAGKFGNKMLRKKNCADRPTVFWNLFARRTGCFFFRRLIILDLSQFPSLIKHVFRNFGVNRLSKGESQNEDLKCFSVKFNFLNNWVFWKCFCFDFVCFCLFKVIDNVGLCRNKKTQLIFSTSYFDNAYVTQPSKMSGSLLHL